MMQAAAIVMAPDHVRRRPGGKAGAKKNDVHTWAVPGATSTLTLSEDDKERLLARRLLAAVDLLQQAPASGQYWTPGMLCKACELTEKQLQPLVQKQIILIEKTEVRRNPFLGRTIPASTPLRLTSSQQQALEHILVVASHPILLHGVMKEGKPTAMVAWTQLSDADLAAVITYTRNSWGNRTGEAIQPSEIKLARK